MSNVTEKAGEVKGVLPVFQVPYHEDGTIDYPTLSSEIDWLLGHGADGLVFAMVSEVLRLSDDERRTVAEHVCRHVAGRGSVVISVGAESLRGACAFARHAESIGAAAVMAIPPVSVALDDTELARYYRGLLEAVSLPVIVQDASGYVGQPMSIGLQAGLREAFGDRVMYKPEATPIGPRLSALHEATGGGAIVFEGSGGIMLVDAYRRGIAGTMPGADLIHAQVALWRALEAGDERRIYELWLPLAGLVLHEGSLDGYLAVSKYLLHKQGVFPNRRVRGPVGYAMDEPTRREVDRLYERLMRALASPAGV